MSRWITYRYNTNPDDWLLEKKGAVYCIFGDGKLIYIGSTNMASARINQHGIRYTYSSNRVRTDWGKFQDVKVKVKYSRRFGDWAMIELRLIRRLRPPHNKRHCTARATST